ncbi:LysR family transcriptional regulator [Cupriavidus gilardii CR3]|uniref:LysR family transcriptional regulator n=1 Tax=Cupriavidus gilardii TaxID=82541 RepID=A0A849B3Y4_9BURK|nr:LysR family transcriptional regulator [Cupriavidus gilardii]ALD92757.1 LysR family transcriptional regulator [Cupriavidus gilardii CR3]KAB0597454.1 LysR family transcriptional regulator [Cupriavidus gilardii]MCT9014424.1 LysR family transcriptional regulator [Cupriavidus gilardii]MCT9054144.1 LysR family transcriptional regulator [Cupriavidus gilardii]NNH10201.1 LysR family transcriptional regulator [Cupriavidus gilardii]
METRHLRYFLAVIDHGSVSRAADWLGIAQPALSTALARMETDLGVRLFERSRRGAQPTPAALAILDDVRTSVERIDAAARRAQEIGRGSAGQLTIGLVSSALFDTLPRALRELRRRAPGVRVILREMSNAEQAEALRTGAIDIGLMHTPVAVGGRMRERPLLRDRLVAAIPDELEPGPDGKVSLAQIADAGLVMYPQSQLPAFHAGILDAMRKAGHEAYVAQEANRTLTVLACVAGGCGVALLPSWIRSLNFRGVRFCEVRDGAALPTFDLSAIWPARSVPTLADLFAGLEMGPA